MRWPLLLVFMLFLTISCAFRPNSRAFATFRRGGWPAGATARSDQPLTNSGPSGLMAVYKPPAWSSHDAVARVRGAISREMRRIGGIEPKVGHGGTLDPLATGVLLMGVGHGTKLMQNYLKGSKKYIATAQAGTATDSQDILGKVVDTGTIQLSLQALQAALPQFIGDIMQTPPMFSAKKVDGQRLYELARQGIEVDRQPCQVTVYDLKLINATEQDLKEGRFKIEVECSGGFYVRTLLDDLAKSLGTVAHMTALERTLHGPFTPADCLHIDQRFSYEDICKNVQRCSEIAKLDKFHSGVERHWNTPTSGGGGAGVGGAGASM